MFTALWPDRAQAFAFTLRPKVGKGDQSFLRNHVKRDCPSLFQQYNIPLVTDALIAKAIFVTSPRVIEKDIRSRNENEKEISGKLNIVSFLNNVRQSTNGKN